MTRAIILALGAALLASVAFGQTEESTPAARDGRYTLVPVEEGFLRLDTATGHVTRCTGGADALSCRALPDEKRDYEAEIRRLEERVEVLEGRMTNLEVPPRRQPPATAGDLPSDEEVDRFFTLSERVMRRFFDLARELEREFKEEPL